MAEAGTNPSVSTEAPTLPDATPSRLWFWMWRLVRWSFGFVLLLAVGIAAIAATLLYPYVRDDLVLDGVVRTVALDWRDFGREKAEERLRFEFSAQELGRHVRPSDCQWREDGDTRDLTCSWTIRFRDPQGQEWPVDFVSSVQVSSDGSLR